MKFKHGKNLCIKDKRSVFIGKDVVIGNNVTIYENNRIEGECIIGDGVTIFPGNFLKNVKVGNISTIRSSDCEDSSIGSGCSIGPFSRIRPNSEIKDNAKIGNFVEIKNAIVGKGTKISHLAYVGDAEIGEDCNIGCGAIFVNYNGKSKNKTIIGDKCFIGSNCNVIAPVTIESSSYICAGTTVTENVKYDDFVIGRVRQEIKSNRAHNYLKGEM